MVRAGTLLLAGAAILTCVDMLVCLKLWFELVEAKGIPISGRLLSTTPGALPIGVLALGAFIASA